MSRLALRLQQRGHDVIHTFDLARQNRTADPFLLTLVNQDQRVLLSLDFLCSGEKDIRAFAESRHGRRRRAPTSKPKASPGRCVVGEMSRLASAATGAGFTRRWIPPSIPQPCQAV
jgi:hypothetical protein